MGGEAGFSAPQLAKARAAPVEMTMFGGGRERQSGRYAPLGNAGILRCAQNDDVKLTTARTTATAKAKTTAKTKYRDLSTAAAKCAAFGRDDVCYGAEREQATARATARAKARAKAKATARAKARPTARTTARTTARAGWEDVYIPTLAAI